MNDQPALGTLGQNTISRAELAAHFRRRGHDHAADAAAAVFDGIVAHRGPESEAPGDRSALADAEHAIGNVIRHAEGTLLEEDPDARVLARELLAICAQWTGGLLPPARAYRLITDTGGTRHLVDGGGVRYFTEAAPGYWEAAVEAGNWAAWQGIAGALSATPEPDRLAAKGGSEEGGDRG